MKDFIAIDNDSIDKIIYNALVLFRYNDLGSKIDTSINKEIKKDSDRPPENAPLQLRLRLHNRFNMDLNNVYAIEFIPKEENNLIETSVNVYHDEFNIENFDEFLQSVFDNILKNVTLEFLLDRFKFNFKNVLMHWKAAKEKQFIIDPQVDRLKAMHDVFIDFLTKANEQISGNTKDKAAQYLSFNPNIVLEKRKTSYAKSKILKVSHIVSKESSEQLLNLPHLFSVILLEFCLIPLFLCNELYVMSLIYNRDLKEIKTVLEKRVTEI